MAHDVFVSYSVKDKVVADAIVARLEADSIRCWVAPRDVVPGADWGESIINAIESSRIMVLVFTSSANASPQIKREVERAVDKGVYTIPIRIENIEPTKSLEYFISTSQWMDAFPPPLEPHLDFMAKTVKAILAGRPPPLPPAASAAAARSEPAAPLDRGRGFPRPRARRLVLLHPTPNGRRRPGAFTGTADRGNGRGPDRGRRFIIRRKNRAPAPRRHQVRPKAPPFRRSPAIGMKVKTRIAMLTSGRRAIAFPSCAGGHCPMGLSLRETAPANFSACNSRAGTKLLIFRRHGFKCLPNPPASARAPSRPTGST